LGTALRSGGAPWRPRSLSCRPSSTRSAFRPWLGSSRPPCGPRSRRLSNKSLRPHWFDRSWVRPSWSWSKAPPAVRCSSEHSGVATLLASSESPSVQRSIGNNCA
jgi:hypothetical protein